MHRAASRETVVISERATSAKKKNKLLLYICNNCVSDTMTVYDWEAHASVTCNKFSMRLLTTLRRTTFSDKSLIKLRLQWLLKRHSLHWWVKKKSFYVVKKVYKILTGFHVCLRMHTRCIFKVQMVKNVIYLCPNLSFVFTLYVTRIYT